MEKQIQLKMVKTMRVARYEFRGDEVQILPIGDLHIGSPHSEYRKAIKLMEEYKEAKIVFVGDLIDNAIIDSVGDVYEQEFNPQGALLEVDKIFEKFQDRILGVVSGNHERRTKKKVGVDVIELLCLNRRIPYAEDILIIDLAVKPNNDKRMRGLKNRTHYAIVLHHGTGGGRFIEKTLRQHRYFTDLISNIDVYIAGHVHQLGLAKQGVWEYDSKNKVESKRIRNMVTVSAWVDEVYATQKMLSPNVLSGIIITLKAGRFKKVAMTIFDI